MELLKKLAEAFNVEENVVLEKLNLTETSDSKSIAKALGVYGLFQDKNEIENYIKNKVQNKMNEIDALKTELANKDKSLVDYENSINQLNEKNSKLNAHILENFEKKWNELNFPKIDFKSEVNIDDLDWSNLHESALKIAKDKQLEPIFVAPENIKDSTKSEVNNVPNTQILGVGARRIG